TQAPDHPLVTTGEGEYEDEFDRRADEMLGMLDVDADESGSEAFEDTAERRGFQPDFGEQSDSDITADELEGQDREAEYDVDTDLAELSDRLDEPSEGSVPHLYSADDGDDKDAADVNEFRELDEYSLGDATEAGVDEHSEAPVTIGEEQADEPDLDLETAQEQEADEVFGEAGTRDDEALEFDLDSEFGAEEP